MDWERMLGLDERTQRARAEAIAHSLRERWSDLAPSSTYRDALDVVLVDESTAEVRLRGPSVFLERDVEARDARGPLLASPKAKTGLRHQRYLAVPVGPGVFRTASSFGPPWNTKARPSGGRIAKVLSQLVDVLHDTRGEL